MTRTVHGVSRLPLIGSIVSSYAAHYDSADQQDAEKLSKKVSGFFGRWSIKFLAEYYEAKEKDEAAKAHTRAQAGAVPPSAVGPPRP
jgi:hypothetical protein